MRDNGQASGRGGRGDKAGETYVQAARRRGLDLAGQMVLGGALIAMPATLWALGRGSYAPFAVAIAALTIAFAARAMLHRDRVNTASAVFCAGFSGIGAMLTLADPAMVDFGLTIVLVMPVIAALTGDKSTSKFSYVMSAIGVSLGALGAGMTPAFGFGVPDHVTVLATVTFTLLSAVAIAVARKMSNSVEAFERSQIETYRHLIEQQQNAIIRISPAGEVIFVSPTVETLFGGARYDLQGSGIVDRIHVQDRPAYMTAFADANENGSARHVELRMRRDRPGQDGGIPQFVWVEISLTPVVHEGRRGGRHETMLLLRDISSRKAQEEAMCDAREAAQQASDAKSRFLATVGHELRTPLNAIVGFSDMLINDIAGELEDGQREYVRLINKSGLHLLDIVNMLLDVSKIEAGRFELHLEEFTPDDLVEPSINMVAPMAVERNVVITTEIEPGLPRILGDERACRQILINLLSNAIKFSHEGGAVTFGMRRQGGHLLLSVTDKGIGMSREVMRRIGEPFFQAQQTHARQYEGTGLGMSIAKGLLELHEGRLEVASVPGEGTSVVVFLPLLGPKTAGDEDDKVAALPLRPHLVAEAAPVKTRSVAQ